MCPDKSILSAWFDGEVDGNWGEKISSHLESCLSCSSYIEKLKKQRVLLHSLPEPDFQDSLERVRTRIRQKRTVNDSRRFWERRIPLPAAAAAAVLVAAFSLGANVLAGQKGNSYDNPALASASGYSTEVASLPGAKVDEIFRMMARSSNEEFSSNTIMELPSDVSLMFNGDSEMLRTAGYEGSASP